MFQINHRPPVVMFQRRCGADNLAWTNCGGHSVLHQRALYGHAAVGDLAAQAVPALHGALWGHENSCFPGSWKCHVADMGRSASHPPHDTHAVSPEEPGVLCRLHGEYLRPKPMPSSKRLRM